MDDVTNLVAFKAISKFVKDLSEEFTEPAKHMGLQLYNRLVEKTTIAHETPVAKHVETFTKYCVANKDAILSQDVEKFTSETESVTYSEKVTFNITRLLKEDADEECRNIIIDHLLIILGIVDRTASFDVKAILRSRQMAATSSAIDTIVPSDSKEGKFINDIMNDVSSAVDPTKMNNPVEAIQSMLTSPAFSNMLTKMKTGMESGDLDLGRLIGTIGNVVGTIGGGDASGSNPMGGVLNPLMNVAASFMSQMPPPRSSM